MIDQYLRLSDAMQWCHFKSVYSGSLNDANLTQKLEDVSRRFQEKGLTAVLVVIKIGWAKAKKVFIPSCRTGCTSSYHVTWSTDIGSLRAVQGQAVWSSRDLGRSKRRLTVEMEDLGSQESLNYLNLQVKAGEMRLRLVVGHPEGQQLYLLDALSIGMYLVHLPGTISHLFLSSSPCLAFQTAGRFSDIQTCFVESKVAKFRSCLELGCGIQSQSSWGSCCHNNDACLMCWPSCKGCAFHLFTLLVNAFLTETANATDSTLVWYGALLCVCARSSRPAIGKIMMGIGTSTPNDGQTISNNDKWLAGWHNRCLLGTQFKLGRCWYQHWGPFWWHLRPVVGARWMLGVGLRCNLLVHVTYHRITITPMHWEWLR